MDVAIILVVFVVVVVGALVWAMLNDTPDNIRDAEACERFADAIDEALASNPRLTPQKIADARKTQRYLRARAKRSRSGWRLTRW